MEFVLAASFDELEAGRSHRQEQKRDSQRRVRYVCVRPGVVGAFTEGFGCLTPDFGVGMGQDRGC